MSRDLGIHLWVILVVARLSRRRRVVVVVVVILCVVRRIGADELLPLEEHAVVLERRDEEPLVAMFAPGDALDRGRRRIFGRGGVGPLTGAAVLRDGSGVVERHDGTVEVQTVLFGERPQVEAVGVRRVRQGGGGVGVRRGAEEASGGPRLRLLLLVPVGEVALLAVVVLVVAHRCGWSPRRCALDARM